MNELTLLVTGWVATEPKLHVSATGPDVVSFRLATTARYFDRNSNTWVDKPTEWFTVRLFRAAAVLVQKSVHKGQPVIVSGRLRTNEWTSESGPRTDLIIDAQAVGHDLTRGVADFRRAVADAEKGVITELPATPGDEGADDGESAEPIDVSALEELPGDDSEGAELDQDEAASRHAVTAS